MKYRALMVAIAAAWTSNAAVWTAGETLIELARRSAPKPVLVERMRELLPGQFAPMVAQADLIVHGRVKPIRTYLSDDQRELFTDYQVTTIHVMFQGAVQVSKSPGPAEPIVFTVWGGRTTIEGVEVVLRDTDGSNCGTRSRGPAHQANEMNAQGHLFEKLGVTSRTEAVKVATRRGLVCLG